MTLPNALIIGPQKSGTTWIYKYLLLRNDICLPGKVKETMFFDKNYNKKKEWYSNFFNPTKKSILTVEVAPTYFAKLDSARRIYNALGKIQLICTFRDPADRCFSHYLHMRKYGMTACDDFLTAIDVHPEIIDCSRYALHLERWIKLFGESSVLILFQDELINNPIKYTKKICKHLHIDWVKPDSTLGGKVNAATLPKHYAMALAGQNISDWLRGIGLYSLVNIAKYLGLKAIFFNSKKNIPKINQKERFVVYDRLHSDIRNLECIISKDLSKWMNK
jgi:hypothetical protein